MINGLDILDKYKHLFKYELFINVDSLCLHHCILDKWPSCKRNQKAKVGKVSDYNYLCKKLYVGSLNKYSKEN